MQVVRDAHAYRMQIQAQLHILLLGPIVTLEIANYRFTTVSGSMNLRTIPQIVKSIFKTIYSCRR